MTPLAAADAARFSVRPLLPGPPDALRAAVLGLGGGDQSLVALARHGAVEALAVEGLGADQTRVLERELRRLGGEVLSSRDGDHAVLLGPLQAVGELPARLIDWGRRTEQLGAAIREALAGRAGLPPPITAGTHTLEPGRRTLVMGVINTTPDSFSGDGLGDDVEAAVARGVAMAEAGADILDVGGESTRPNMEPVDEAVELGRVLPVISRLAARVGIPVSIDTRHATVAERALEAGAVVVNDIWGLRRDPRMAAVVAEWGVAVVVMHNAAEVAEGDVVAAVCAGLRQSLAVAEAAGIDLSRVIVDPGLGFAKTPAGNLEILRRLGELRGMGRAIMVGASRKSTIGFLLDGAPPDRRLEGSLALATLAVAGGAHIVRVHDVAETVRAVRVADAVVRGTPQHILELPPPGRTG
jgi:dihydropteroate synthase